MAIVTYKGKRFDSQERMDAGTSLFFLRQLEDIDAEAYQVQYPSLMARQLIPPEKGIAPGMHVRTYRQYDKKGIAALISDMSDDLPSADATGAEFSSTMKWFGASYQYDIDEIEAAAATNTPLEQLRANAARWACERQVDQVLANGTLTRPDGTTFAVPGMLGLTNQTGTTSYTLGTKALGGTTWGTINAPNASGDEVAWDIMGMANNIFEATSQIWSSFRFLMNPKQFDYAAQKRLGSVSDTTALAFAKASCPYIENVYPWWQIPAGTIVAFAPDPTVAAAVVPVDWTVLPPQLRNMVYRINTRIKCGGVISRYPVAISYATGA